jgi:hypothetical protein
MSASFCSRCARGTQNSAALTARLAKIGCELAELEPKFPAAPLGDWV